MRIMSKKRKADAPIISTRTRTLARNRKGVSSTIDAMLLVGMTSVAMLIVISSSSSFITARNEQMGERLYVERIANDTTHINLYVRNVGHGDITLAYYIINGTEQRMFDPRINVPTPEANPLAKETLVTIPREDGKKVYIISLYSSRDNELGKIEVDLS